MIDLDRNRQPKGIFEMGEEFIYKCTIENDVGTSVTPDLSVLWNLPPELEFVRGVGDRGATVTGSGQTCESSSFVLAPPSGVQNFEITVRVIGVPERKPHPDARHCPQPRWTVAGARDREHDAQELGWGAGHSNGGHQARATGTVDAKPNLHAMLMTARAHAPRTGASTPSSSPSTAWCIALHSKNAS